MRATASLIPTLLAAVILGGCIGGDDLPADDAPAPLPVLTDALAALSAGDPSANVERLADLGVGMGQELDAWGDYLAVMQNPKVIIVDVADPTAPEKVGEIQLAAVLDVKWSDDGQWLFVANDDEGSVPDVTDDQLNGGIYVIDVSDKSDPTLASFHPVGPRRGPHMVTYHRMPDGREIVTGANADISVNVFDRASGTLSTVARYSPDLVTGFDRTPERVDVLYGVQGWAHDAFIQDEPDGRTFMYVANWDAGLRIVDVSDPAQPTEVGAWTDWPDGHSGNLHTVSTLWIDDRRITVGSPELGFAVVGGTHYALGDEVTGVYVWDTTDPADVDLVGFWTHPEDACHFAGRDQFADEDITSTHNLQLEAGRVYLAHYACGAYVLDVSTPGLQAAPELLAFDRGEGLVEMWDLVVHRGAMYYGDDGGVFSARFALDTVGPGGVTSRA